jgi:hypothetical protein
LIRGRPPQVPATPGDLWIDLTGPALRIGSAPQKLVPLKLGQTIIELKEFFPEESRQLVCLIEKWDSPLDTSHLPQGPCLVLSAAGPIPEGSGEKFSWADGPILSLGANRKIFSQVPAGGDAALTLPNTTIDFETTQTLPEIVNNAPLPCLRAAIKRHFQPRIRMFDLSNLNRKELLTLILAVQSVGAEFIQATYQQPNLPVKRLCRNLGIRCDGKGMVEQKEFLEALSQWIPDECVGQLLQEINEISHVIPTDFNSGPPDCLRNSIVDRNS